MGIRYLDGKPTSLGVATSSIFANLINFILATDDYLCGGVRSQLNGSNLSLIDIVVPEDDVRRVHLVLARRLSEKGHDVALVAAGSSIVPSALQSILWFERKILVDRHDDLLAPAENTQLSSARSNARLRIDLSGSEQQLPSPVFTPRFTGSASLAQAARSLMSNRLPMVEILLDNNKCVAQATPMVDSRMSINRGLDDVLARMVTLLVNTADRYLRGEMIDHAYFTDLKNHACPGPKQLISSYVFSAMPRQAMKAFQHVAFHVNRWRVSYRFHKGRRVADTGLLADEPWITLPDDGNRFYADPFPFEFMGRYFIFVEDLRHGEKKAVISVTEILPDGTSTVPRCVLAEPYHLSYPQVFSHEGQIWMLPEGAAGNNLVLYRAESFPDRWVRHSVLIPNRELFDATLLEHDGRLWLFATERDGYGSASDTLVVYHASCLTGPWTPHGSNPVKIDRAAARPGGSFVRVGDRLVLPLQDGTREYGGSLGLADLVELNETTLRLTQPVPLLASARMPYPRIHTLNSSEHLEVIDRIAPSPRLSLRRFK